MFHLLSRRKKIKERSKSFDRPAIIQVVGYFPPHLGGMENVAQEISHRLANQGWPIEVITSDVSGGNMSKYEDKGNYSVRRLRTVEFAHTPFMPTLWLRLLFIRKPAIIHLHLAQASLPETVWIIAKLRRIPYIVHFHLDVQPSGRLGFLFRIYKMTVQPVVLRGAACVIALSHEQRKLITERYSVDPKKVKFIPNGVSDEYLKIGKKPRSMHYPLRLLFVGRLSPQKRLDLLLEAMAEIKGDVELYIVGEGEDSDKLKNLAMRLKLENVTFTGPKYGDDLLSYYENSDIFVLPSEREGMPLVLLEAMASGLPVIGSNVPGIREYLTGTGILLGDPVTDKLVAAIDKFCDSYNTPWFSVLSKASAIKARTYSWPKLTDQLEKLYKTISRDKTTWQLRRASLVMGIAIWWLAFLGIRSINSVPEAVINTVGFSFLIIVPGMLSVASLRLKIMPWAKLALSIALSVLELMAVALAGNTLLQLVGVKRPLDSSVLIPELSALLLVLIAVFWHRAKDWEFAIRQKIHELLPTSLDKVIAFLPLVFIALSVMGATSLNNGGADGFTMAMLIGVGLYAVIVYFQKRKLTDTSIATSLFLVSIAILLMNSLRGWYTTGHDIQLEYWVFQLTKTQGVWHIQNFRNAYNACLSITILPTIFANVLKVFDPYVYKVFFQILFATCPPIIYLLFRKWVAASLAFLGAFYFIAFPTFFTDMSFLNRQEIAFIFFALMLLIAFQDQISGRMRNLLFLTMGLGSILSHYSTTYSMLAIFLMAILFRPLIILSGGWLGKLKMFSKSSLRALRFAKKESKQISLAPVSILICMTVLWTVVLTNTGGNALSVAHQSISTITSSFKVDQPKSNSTDYSLLSSSTGTPAQEFTKYLTESVNPLRSQNPGLYYPSADYSQYSLNVATSTTQPLTSLGKFFSKLGLNVTSFNYVFRQATAKLIQVLVLSGFIYILFRKTYSRFFESDYIALCLGSIVFVALQVVLPILSVQYGLLRAFQQSLIVLGLMTVFGSIALFAWVPYKKLRLTLPVLLAVVFFLSSTGVISQSLGGYYGQLNLSNSGVYYDTYYTHAQEIAGIEWLNQVAGKYVDGQYVQSPVQADLNAFNRLSVYTPIVATNDIYPGSIRRDAYVFLNYANVTQGVATITYNNDLITYTYPVQFLNQQKNLIYSNGGVEVYR